MEFGGDRLGKNTDFESSRGALAARLLPFGVMIKIKSGYSDSSADDLFHMGSTVGENLPTLPIFGALKPTPADIEAATLALDAARKMHGPGRKQAIAAAEAALAQLLSLIAVNAPQVPSVTDTQLAEIGLPVKKTPQRETKPPPPGENVRLFHGENPGEITGRCAPLKHGVRIYEAQWTLDPNGSDWSDPVSFPNSRAIRFTGLTRGKDVWVRVRGVNTIGAGAWSDPASIMVT
jgi:hypothetical protein